MILLTWIAAIAVLLFTELPRLAWHKSRSQVVLPLRAHLLGVEGSENEGGKPPHGLVRLAGNLSTIGLLSSGVALVTLIAILLGLTVLPSSWAPWIVAVGLIIFVPLALVAVACLAAFVVGFGFAAAVLEHLEKITGVKAPTTL